MDIYNIIEQTFITYFDKYKTSKNQLLFGILHTIKLLSQDDLHEIKIHFEQCIKKIENENNNNDNIALNFLMSLIFNKLAMDIVYSLPHMLNKSLLNNNLSTHILFGESVAQLVAFCLVTESSNIINKIFKRNPKILLDINMNVHDVNEIILNISDQVTITKDIIRLDYIKKKETLYDKYNEYFSLFYKSK